MVHCRRNSIPLEMAQESRGNFELILNMNRDQQLAPRSIECSTVSMMEKSLECMLLSYCCSLEMVQCILIL